MIISFRHNYIFIRTKKTASTTIQQVLADTLGSEDIVTRRGANARAALNAKAQESFHQHMTAAEIMPWLPEGFWERAFKFTVERHPYEKAVSMAYYRYRKRRRNKNRHSADDEFADRLDKTVRGGEYATYQYYSIDGRPAMNDYIRQEDLIGGLKRVGARIGISVPDELPGWKVHFRLDRRPAAEILSEKQKKIVYRHCEPEFEFLGYER